jgi:hypothetical protein
MLYNEKFLNKLINKALSIAGYSITIEEINEQQGAVLKDKKKSKDVLPYYIKYPFHNDEEYDKFIKYVKEEVQKLKPSWDENKVTLETSILDMGLSLSQPYLFEKPKVQPTLF